VDLSGSKLGIKHTVEASRRSLSLTETGIGIDGIGRQKITGVWVGVEKITAIGIAVIRGVSMHGFAFNVIQT
jgi:lipoyl(octanoyl) transferase